MGSLADCGLWRGPPMILASRSAGRARLLAGAGVPFEAVDSRLEERALPGVESLSPIEQARALAREKARVVSARWPGRTVVGADQTLAFEGRTIHKAPDRSAAIGQFSALGGKAHELHSAVACMCDGELLFDFVESAIIRMRALDARIIEAYALGMTDTLLSTVGGYEIEGFGVNLIDQVRGDMFTVIGLPLFRLLAELRRIGLIDEGEARR